MEFESLKHLKQTWFHEDFDFPKEIHVKGVLYQLHRFPVDEPQHFENIILNAKPGYIAYSAREPDKDQWKEAGLHQLIILVWAVNSRAVVVPYDIRTMPARRFTSTRVLEDSERIGDVAILKIFLPSGTSAIKGKVDTGAEISSLHADQYKIVGDTVKFVNKEMSENVISVPIVDHLAVKSADGGVEYRPVIELDIEINGKPVRKALFNLNNREQMEYPCLIGQNVLEKTNFLIDPKIDDPATGRETFKEDDWIDLEQFPINLAALHEEFKDIDPTQITESEKIDPEKIQSLYDALGEADITFKDLIRFVRTDARKVIEDIEY